MQISGVSLALTWPHRVCLLRVLLCVSLYYKLSPFQAHWERRHCTRFPRPACLFTFHVGSGSSLLSCGVFLPPPLSQAFLLLVAGFAPLLPPEPLRPARLVYLQSREGFPSPNLQHSGRPTLFPMCLCCSYCLLVSFSFFLGWRSVCPGGYAALAQACLWEYRSTAKLTWSASSQPIWVWATGSPGALLVSPFNVKWRFSAPCGGVEGSKFCLFSVIMPAKCVSSVSPKFHYRRLTFCFFPLAAILDSPHKKPQLLFLSCLSSEK
jgi:hypothetical protein